MALVAVVSSYWYKSICIVCRVHLQTVILLQGLVSVDKVTVKAAKICGSMMLCNLQGLVSVDKVSHQVTVRAGTTLTELIELLHQHGLAMKNLGAIPHQTVAGAITTGIQKVQEDTPSPYFRPIGILSLRSHSHT